MRRLPIYRLLLFGVSCLAPAHAASDGVQPADTTALFRYERAYDEMAAMLDSSDSVCLKRAVFLPEWAYVGDELNYDIYCARLNTMAAALRAFIAANRLDDAPIGAHIALFEFFVRPYAMNGYKPFDYEFEDCDGEVDFTNTFVTKLMRTHSGQCRSLPLLYKLLANEIGAEAYIAYAPCHTFVRHRDETGEGWINVELTSRNLPRDEFIIETMGITQESIDKGIYMKPCGDREILLSLLVEMASGYLKKIGYIDPPVWRCIETVLARDSTHLTALMVKSNCLNAIAQQQLRRLVERGLPVEPFVEQLRAIFSELNGRIDRTGYVEMPEHLREASRRAIDVEIERRKTEKQNTNP